MNTRAIPQSLIHESLEDTYLAMVKKWKAGKEITKRWDILKMKKDEGFEE